MAFLTTATDYMLYLRDILLGRRFASERACAVERCVELSTIIDMSYPRDILDLGCGRMRPQSIILSKFGHRVVGVDLADTKAVSLKNLAYAVLRTLLSLSTPSSHGTKGTLKVVNADVGSLPFAAQSFDVVVSIAAFEHFLDVPQVVSEMRRILRPGGVFSIDIHIFTALSGGHTVGMRLDPIGRLPAGIQPWDHLRDQRLTPSVPLNRWRISQYLEALSAEFTIVKSYALSTEGAQFLTDAVRLELANYSEEELLSGCYRIVGMKKD